MNEVYNRAMLASIREDINWHKLHMTVEEAIQTGLLETLYATEQYMAERVYK